MKNLQLDYSDQYEVRNYINTVVVEQIKDNLSSYDSDEDTQHDALYHTINTLSDVVYNYQAKMVSEAFGLSPFDYSEITGDRFSSYSEMAFDVIMDAYNNVYQWKH